SEFCVVRVVAPFFGLTLVIRGGAFMRVRMSRPPLVFVCVGDVLFSLFRATGEFMFAGSRRVRFCRRRPLRFRLRRPVNGGDVLSWGGGGVGGPRVSDGQHAWVVRRG